MKRDFEKAYDRVGHKYLTRVLKAMNTPWSMIRKLKDIYRNSNFRVFTINGVTDLVKYGRGVKQGDPLSPILFDIALEPLLRRIIRKGTGLANSFGIVKKVSAYADDVMLFAKNKEDENKMLKAVIRYEKASGGSQ